jgi:hypothetical protein
MEESAFHPLFYETKKREKMKFVSQALEYFGSEILWF